MTKEKLLNTLTVTLEISTSTQSYHNDNYHYYKGRTDALNEVLKELSKLEEAEEKKGEQEWQVKKR